MNNLLIIGNGFDLAHNLKTHYNDFINHILDSNLKNRELFKTLINLNNNITTKEQLIEYAFKTPLGKMNHFPNKFFGALIGHFSMNNWCDIEERYYTLLVEENRYESINKFHEDFEEVKSYLSRYLNEIELNSAAIYSYEYLFSNLMNSNSLLLNFNYTNTLKNYSNQYGRLTNNNIINIHGELNNPNNPIIFGFAANDKESRELINKNDKEYMRFIKKHCYKRTNNEENLKLYLDENKKINVFIIGHSCGISDKLILNEIFNHKNIDSLRTFYFEEHEKYFETQVNIDRIMNNDYNFKKLKSFESSIRMPQINDNESQKQDFIKYIDDFISNQTLENMMNPGTF